MHDHEGRLLSTGMTRRKVLEFGAAAAVAPAVTALAAGGANGDDEDKSRRLRVDPSWPKPLPDNWITAEVAGNAVDSHDHIWIVTRWAPTPENFTDRQRRMARQRRAQRRP